jgi:beta-glucosidase
VHAPGRRDSKEALQVAHHLLLSHGQAVGVIRSIAPEAEIGIALNLSPGRSATQTAADRDAVRQFDGFFNRWYLDPLLRGRYPDDAIADRVRWGHLESGNLPFVQDGDLDRICAPMDYLGVNFYGGTILAAGEDGRPKAIPAAPREELTEMGWEIRPQGLVEVCERLMSEYDLPPLYITENGAAFVDPNPVNGRIRDPRRVAYLRDHLIAAHRVLSSGIPLRGCFAWSLMDNFEWGQGFTKRFGLYAVDRVTGARIPKESAFWYRETIAARAAEDGKGSET